MNKQMNRRFCTRVEVGSPCVLYMNGIEVNGSIHDISETGICIKFDKSANGVDKSKLCEKGMIFEFASIDNFENLERKMETAIFSGSAKVIWSDGMNMVGCQFTNIPRSLENYIKAKKDFGVYQEWVHDFRLMVAMDSILFICICIRDYE